MNTTMQQPAAPKEHPADSGHIEAVEITRPLTRLGGRHAVTGPQEIQFAGRPISRSSKAQRVRMVFVDARGELPPPAFHPRDKRIDIFYSLEKYHSLRNWLDRKATRLCYLWISSDGANRQAWLVPSPV